MLNAVLGDFLKGESPDVAILFCIHRVLVLQLLTQRWTQSVDETSGECFEKFQSRDGTVLPS